MPPSTFNWSTDALLRSTAAVVSAGVLPSLFGAWAPAGITWCGAATANSSAMIAITSLIIDIPPCQ
jgi:hypothetical protein